MKINVLHKVDWEERAERDRIVAENEAEEKRKLQEKLDSGLETDQERRSRRTADKLSRNRERETQRVAKNAVKRELKKRGLKSVAERMSRDTAKGSGSRQQTDGASTDDADAGGDSLSAMLAAARAEVEDDIEAGLEGDELFPSTNDDTEPADRGERASRSSSVAARKSRQSRGSKASRKGKGKSMSELTEEQLAALATDPRLLARQLRAGNIQMGKEEGTRSSRASRRTMGANNGDIIKEGNEEEEEEEEEEGEEEEEEDESEIEEGYEVGTCVQYNESLGIRMLFMDFDGLHDVEREEWVKLADVPMVVKIGKNEELEQIWRDIDLTNQPILKKLFYSKARIAAEYDSKKEAQASWLDKIMGAKNLGIKTYYPLFLPDHESGAKDVQGNIGLRLIYHTRGTVLRGIDEVVSTMSLGEKVCIHIREDYAFGEAFGHYDLPPNSDIIVEVDLIGVRGAGFLYLLVTRRLDFMMHKIWLVLQLLIWIFELNRIILCPLWCKAPWITRKKTHDDEFDDGEFDESAMLDGGDSKPSVEEVPAEKKEVVRQESLGNNSTLAARLLFSKN